VLLLVAACAPSPSSVFDDFIDAMERKDLEATLAFFADDFVMETSEGRFRATREYLPLLIEWNFAADTRMEVREKHVTGDTVTVVVWETNPFLELTGMGPHLMRSHYVVNGRQFTRQTFELLEGHGEMRRAIKPAVSWAKIHDPEALEKVYPGGKFVYTGDAVRNWITLLRKWKAATATTDSLAAGS
jgi:hypothetical protein